MTIELTVAGASLVLSAVSVLLARRDRGADERKREMEAIREHIKREVEVVWRRLDEQRDQITNVRINYLDRDTFRELAVGLAERLEKFGDRVDRLAEKGGLR